MMQAVQTFKLLGGAALLLAAAGAAAQSFTLEGAVVDSRSGRSLGVVTERGDINALFRAQKAMTFGILRSAGISLEQLSPEVRARIERFQTTNLEAFRAFSQGLDLKDQGKYGEAREQFRRAAELDPGFTLAAEQQQSMPDVNLGGAVQLRAVVAAAAGAAVDRGKAAYVVDVARAVAAIAAGQTVVLVPSESARLDVGKDYRPDATTDAAAQNALGLVAALSYTYANSPTTQLSIAATTEWRVGSYLVAGDTLESVGARDTGASLRAARGTAAVANRGSVALGDGSTAYWGSWLSTPDASAVVEVSGQRRSAPELGQVDYLYGTATRQMPTSGSAVFTPAGGLLANAGGSIAVNFVSRDIAVQNLGFSVGNLAFSGLNGSATYDDRIGSGGFKGNYTAGQCSGCAGFTPLSSTFGGNFVGTNANGLAFSTILLTGNGTASGVHLFTRPGQ
jgi:hypothetical protein